MTAATDLARVLDELDRHGLLLLSDQRLPNVVSLIAEEPVRGSWWGSPHGGRIYNVNVALDDHLDVTAVKLVAGKVTFVHRRLWARLVAVGAAGEPWQLDGVPESARKLLELVQSEGEVRTDDVPWLVKPGEAARELERRLLVHGDEVHTESGAHAKILRTWPAWAAHVHLALDGTSAAEAKAHFESILDAMNQEHGARARLRWQPVTFRSARVPAAS
jgi:hypothetical protein